MFCFVFFFPKKNGLVSFELLHLETIMYCTAYLIHYFVFTVQESILSISAAMSPVDLRAAVCSGLHSTLENTVRLYKRERERGGGGGGGEFINLIKKCRSSIRHHCISSFNFECMCS